MPTNINASCDEVTTRQDGSPLVQPIAIYRFEYFEGNNLPSNIQTLDVSPSSTTGEGIEVNITGLTNGPVGVRCRAIDAGGNVGPATAWINGDTSDTPPALPINFMAEFMRV